jgi:hypothetical protein
MSELYKNSVDKRISGLVSDLYSVIGKPVSFNQSPTHQAKIVWVACSAYVYSGSMCI